MIEHQSVEHGKLCTGLRSAVGGETGVISVCRCDHAPNLVCGSSTAYAWSQQPQHYSFGRLCNPTTRHQVASPFRYDRTLGRRVAVLDRVSLVNAKHSLLPKC
jgi:hypothetical protein